MTKLKTYYEYAQRLVKIIALRYTSNAIVNTHGIVCLYCVFLSVLCRSLIVKLGFKYLTPNICVLGAV